VEDIAHAQHSIWAPPNPTNITCNRVLRAQYNTIIMRIIVIFSRRLSRVIQIPRGPGSPPVPSTSIVPRHPAFAVRQTPRIPCAPPSSLLPPPLVSPKTPFDTFGPNVSLGRFLTSVRRACTNPNTTPMSEEQRLGRPVAVCVCVLHPGYKNGFLFTRRRFQFPPIRPPPQRACVSAAVFT